MTWTIVDTIQTTSDWLLTESVNGSLFRISHNATGTNIQSLRSVITQVFDEGAISTYFDFRRLSFKSEAEAILFIQPEGLSNRKLAIKRLDNLADIWTITIEVLEGMPQSISLPIAQSEVIGLEEALASKATSESLNIHVMDFENPHALTAEQIGAEQVGTAAAAAANAISNHKVEENPHPIYATDSEVNVIAASLAAKEQSGTAAAAIASHTGEIDPHQQYATDIQIGQLQAALNGKEAVGIAANLIATLVASQIPQTLPTATIIDYEGSIPANGILSVNGLIWLLLDGLTIGGINSGATRYADSKAQTLFERLWTNPNLVIFGANGVVSSRGASAVSDFDSNKRLALPDVRGRVILPSGTGSGLTARSRGAIGGAETHTLTNNESPNHNHALTQMPYSTSAGSIIVAGQLAGSAELGITNGVTSFVGGGQAHNNMSPFYVASGKLILAGKT